MKICLNCFLVELGNWATTTGDAICDMAIFLKFMRRPCAKTTPTEQYQIMNNHDFLVEEVSWFLRAYFHSNSLPPEFVYPHLQN